MWNSKNIAVILMLLFCGSSVLSNQTFGILFFAENFTLVKTYCENREENIPNQKNPSEENPATPVSSCSSNSIVMFYAEHQLVDTRLPEVLLSQNYYYVIKAETSVHLELQLPPPRLA